MYARHVTTYVKIDRMGEALKIFEDSVIPEGKAQEGYLGIYLLTNKETGKIVSITLWNTQEDARANEESGYYQRQVDKFKNIVTQPTVKEGYDVTIMLSKPR
jgi:heme-degrading monooxygenase HmoA